MRFALIVIACVALCISGVCGAGSSTPIEIDGSGSSSVSQLLSQLMLSYRQANSGITVTYNVSSSSVRVLQEFHHTCTAKRLYSLNFSLFRLSANC
jgi:ABC-type phosphate transport system substrate-binding protein